MKQEDKELLLRDLCGRLPYGVKVQIDLQSDTYPPIICKVCSIEYTESESAFIGVETSLDTYNEVREFLCKPYLFPLSSMTEEQYNSLHELGILDNCSHSYEYVNPRIHGVSFIFKQFKTYSLELIEWLNKNYFDYRGLIPMGLANDATGLNIY